MLSEQIRRARELRGWSQKELAEHLGVAESTVRRWEGGEREPYAYHWTKIQSVLGISADHQPERTRRMNDEQPGTYFVYDPNLDEYKRLDAQAQMISRMQGGALPEQPDPARFRRILDIGCGTGHWLISCARAHPAMSEAVGIDINARTLAFAQDQAKQAGAQNQVRFQVMDALRLLEFRDGYFDLVNLRFGISFIRAWEWPKIVGEMRRVLKPGGTARLVDVDMLTSTSPALNRIWAYGAQAARGAGLLAENVESMTALFRPYLESAQFTAIEMRRTDATYQYGTPEYELFAEDIHLLVQHSEAYLKKWLNVSEYQHLAAQINQEMNSPAFSATWPLVTTWGVR